MAEKVPLCDFLKIDHVIYYPKAGLERMMATVYQYWMQAGVLPQIETELGQREANLLSSLKADLFTFLKNYEAYTPALSLVFSCDRPVADEVRRRLAAKLPAAEVEWFMDKLNIPLKDNYYKKIEYDLVTATDLDQHVKDYEWIHSRYGEKLPYTIEEAQQKLQKIKKDEFLKNWKQDKQKLQETIRKAKEILGVGQENIIDLMQFIIFYRTHRTDVLNKATYLYYDQLMAAADERGVTYQELLHCSEEELRTELPGKEILAERIRDHVGVLQAGQLSFLIGAEADRVKKMFDEDHGEVKEIKGNVACKGVVKGTVKVIRSRNDFAKISSGNILVTSMTTPEMVPIMQKAAAFVTDEGGITCHAAIVSRELKKPCIIGTRIASQVLKDGDQIEVDASTGVVKIINRA